MEVFKDIYFNTDRLIENTKVKVSYTGCFYQGNSDKVYLHYGYGDNWNNVGDVEMNKTDLGFQAEINLENADKLNFCFKNQNNEWDNNFGQNYSFAIEPKFEGFKDNALTKNNLVFLGKIFGTENDNKSANIVEQASNNSGIIESVANNTPNSIDAIFSNNVSVNSNAEINANLNVQENANVVNSEENNCFKVITTSLDVVPQANVNNQINNNATQQQSTAIALAPTGFEYWTQKIKDTVCKFFSYVPKLISGNYKRNISDSKK